MLPSFLIRVGIDSVRRNEEFKDSNPYSRCEESIRTCKALWSEQVGIPGLNALEPWIVTAYWAEFFHAEDPLPDEKEWREGLNKRSGQYDSFEQWQAWFQKTYEQVYKDNKIWQGILMTAWAHTHQLEVRYCQESWEFILSRSYLPTSQMWRLQPHIDTVAEVLREFLLEEMRAYEEAGFSIWEQQISYVGKVECLGFDTKKYSLSWPPRARRENEELEVSEMIADIVAPPGDSWYRHPDNVIFAHDCVDVTALISRARYIFGSRRRLFELTIDNDLSTARIKASAEGWLVPNLEGVSA